MCANILPECLNFPSETKKRLQTCFARAVDDVEKKNGNDPVKDLQNSGFQDYQRPLVPQKDIPITSTGRRGVVTFYARHLTVALTSSPLPFYLRRPEKSGQLQISAWLIPSVECPWNRIRLARLQVRRLDHYTNRHMLIPCQVVLIRQQSCAPNKFS